MNRKSDELIEIDGKKYTRYECTQLQRKIETKIRKLKDRKELLKAAGDDVGVRECNRKIRLLKDKYNEITQKAGLDPHYDRMSVVKSGKIVDIATKSGIINTDNSFHSYGDCLWKKLGSAKDNNPEELEDIVNLIESKGGKIEFHNEPERMVTDVRESYPATIKIYEDASIAAVKHELRHFLDDEANGYPRFSYYVKDNDIFFNYEKRGYEEELIIARKHGFKQEEKEILAEIELRRREIYGIE